MNLKNFEKYFRETILDRGRSYFLHGAVTSLEDNDGTWEATVEGTYDYTVTIELSDDGEITDIECDCPYDDVYCKHSAAVLYMIREREPDGKCDVGKSKKKSAGQVAIKTGLNEIFDKLDKDELISLLKECLMNDPAKEEEIRLRYSENTDIRASVRKILDERSRMIESYRWDEDDELDLSEGIDEVLSIADDKMEEGDPVNAALLCITLMEEIIDATEESRKEYGNEPDITDALNVLIKITSAPMDDGSAEKIFQMIFEHSFNTEYRNSSQRSAVLRTLIPLCRTPSNREAFRQYLTTAAAAALDDISGEFGDDRDDFDDDPDGDHDDNYEDDDWDLSNDKHMQIVHYEFLKEFDGDAVADKFLEEHPDNDDLRRIHITESMDRGLYEKAAELCLEGEEKAKIYYMHSRLGNFFRTDNEYARMRYDAYEKLENVNGMKELGTEFLLSGDLKHLPKLKALYAKDGWDRALRPILDALRTKLPQVYADVLAHENMQEELLKFCTEDKKSIRRYHAQLAGRYKKEVCGIFLNLIKEAAEPVGSRYQYQDVCNIIKEYGKVCNADVDALRNELIVTYSKRPAFKDELRKMKI